MSTPNVPPTEPDPRYRTVQLHIPVVSAGAVAALAAVVVAVAALWIGVAHYSTNSRIDEARSHFAPTVQDVLTRSRSDLDQLEAKLKDLNQSLDAGLAAKSAKAVDVNGYLTAQSDLGKQLDAVEANLATLDGKETEIRATYRIPEDEIVRTPAQQRDLDALHQRIETDDSHLAAIDDRIHAVAEHQQSLAQAEVKSAQAQAANAANLRRQRAAEMAAQSDTDGRNSNPVPSSTTTVVAPGYAYPYAGYPYGYGYGYPYYGGYYGPSVYIGGYWGWGRGGWGGWRGGGGGWHGGGGHGHR
jgi:hypothetical protein